MPKFLKGDYIPENAEKYVGAKKPYYRSSWELAFMKMCDSHPYINVRQVKINTYRHCNWKAHSLCSRLYNYVH